MPEVARSPGNAHPDRFVDGLYRTMRRRHGSRDARANGYRSHTHFLNEQKRVLELVGDNCGTFLDVACGSALMLEPLETSEGLVLGVDFNWQACTDARSNGTKVIRGDAFRLPFQANSIDVIVNCQFLNQQNADGMASFVSEAARILSPNGRLIVVWRCHRSWIHKIGHATLRLYDLFISRPKFPYTSHLPSDVISVGTAAGLQVENASATTIFPWQHLVPLDNLMVRIVGASFVVVMTKGDLVVGKSQ